MSYSIFNNDKLYILDKILMVIVANQINQNSQTLKVNVVNQAKLHLHVKEKRDPDWTKLRTKNK